MRRAPVLLLAASACLVGLLGLLAACSDDPPPAPIDYVAFGDSYSAGVGIPEPDSLACDRSTNDYAHQLTTRLRTAGTPVSLEDVTCSGASMGSLVAPQARPQATVPPQGQALDAGTDLVTFGLGGNDDGIFATLTTVCPGLRERDPAGAPCRRSQRRDGGDRLLAAADRVRDDADRALAAIAERAPRARTVVIGYPTITPESGTCPDLLPLADGDVAWFGEVVDRVNASLRAAARDAGVDFLDLARATRGHDVCSADPWINGARPGPDGSRPIHPRKVVHDLAGRMLQDLLEQDPPGRG